MLIVKPDGIWCPSIGPVIDHLIEQGGSGGEAHNIGIALKPCHNGSFCHGTGKGVLITGGVLAYEYLGNLVFNQFAVFIWAVIIIVPVRILK